MNRNVAVLLYWSPRILGILFSAFISIFALDVFSEHLPFGRTMLAPALHMIPTAIVVMVLLISWKWEWAGAIGYFSLGVIYIITMWKRFPLVTYVAVSGPGLPHWSSFPLRLDQAARIATATGGFRLKSTGGACHEKCRPYVRSLCRCLTRS
jgi:hypothetical protein